MAIGAYTKTTWADSPSTTSPMSDANLQHLEDQVKNITDAAVSGGADPTKIWTSTNDGNAGKAPMPKTTKIEGALLQNAYHTVTLPASGGGCYLVWAWNASTGGAGAGAIIYAGNIAYKLFDLATSAVVSITVSGCDVRGVNLYTPSTISFAVIQVSW